MRYLILIILMSILHTVVAQDTLTQYFDLRWNRVQKQNASFYRKAFKNDKKTWTVIDYYIDGQIQMSGIYKSKRFKKKQGHFVYFFENGQKKSEGDYNNDHNIGSWTAWHETGELHLEAQYDNKGYRTGYWKCWYSSGVLDYEGEYINDEKEKGWLWYFENGQMSSKEIYSKGELGEFEYWDENGNRVDEAEYVNALPEFVGGLNALMKYLVNNIKYPKEAKQSNISGRVFLKFTVEEDGTISDVIITKSVHPLLDEEAKRVVENMPDWIPGRQHNRPVEACYNLPVKFTL